MEITIDHIYNPRVEKEDHFPRPSNKGLLKLGLHPRLLSDELIENMFDSLERHKNRAELDLILL